MHWLWKLKSRLCIFLFAIVILKKKKKNTERSHKIITKNYASEQLEIYLRMPSSSSFFCIAYGDHNNTHSENYFNLPTKSQKQTTTKKTIRIINRNEFWVRLWVSPFILGIEASKRRKKKPSHKRKWAQTSI